jgi:hypothetical protein
MQNFDRIFRDDSGNIVIGQKPNLPIILWGLASLLQIIFTTGPLNTALNLFATGALLIWAGQELWQGVNYFRRGLGLLVLIGLITSKIYFYTK